MPLPGAILRFDIHPFYCMNDADCPRGNRQFFIKSLFERNFVLAETVLNYAAVFLFGMGASCLGQ
jgi:hypothetical protein